jgi:hypothetical protein
VREHAGDRIRVVLSNAFGITPLRAANVALREKGASIVATSKRTLTFNGGVVLPLDDARHGTANELRLHQWKPRRRNGPASEHHDAIVVLSVSR